MAEHGRDSAASALGPASQTLMRWFKLACAVAIVAVVAAAFAVAFRGSLAEAVTWLGGTNIVAMIGAAPVWERVLLPALGGLGAGLVGL
jgi:hypothetical protein